MKELDTLFEEEGHQKVVSIFSSLFIHSSGIIPNSVSLNSVGFLIILVILVANQLLQIQ